MLETSNDYNYRDLDVDNNNISDQPKHPSLPICFLIIGVTFFLMLVTGIIAIFLFSEKMLLVMEMTIIIPAAIFVVAARYPFIDVFRAKKVSLQTTAASVLIAFSVVVVMDEIDRLVAIIFPMPEFLLEEIMAVFTINTTLDGITIIFFAVIAAGIIEEMLFRGLLQQAFERQFNITLGVLFCALVFSFIHLNPWTLIQILLIGIILGVMAWASKSIWPSAIVHAVNNGLAVLLINVSAEELNWYTWHGHVHPLILLIGAIGLYYGFKLFYKSCSLLHNT